VTGKWATGRRQEESEHEKAGTETRCAATGRFVFGWNSDDSGEPKRRKWVALGGGERRSEKKKKKKKKKRREEKANEKRRFGGKGSTGARSGMETIFCRKQCWLDSRSGE
jgi:hypothetical protein